MTGLGPSVSVFISALNCYSVDLAIHVQNVFTVAKLSAILLIIGCGVYQLSLGNTQHLATGFEGSVLTFGGIATAFYGGLYTFDGWYQPRMPTPPMIPMKPSQSQPIKLKKPAQGSVI